MAKHKRKKQPAKKGKQVVTPPEKEKRPLLPAVPITASIVLLVLLQGGFYCGATCIIGILSAIAFIIASVIGKIDARPPLASIVLVIIAVLYFISSAAHGASLSMLQESCSWLAAAGMALWCRFPDAKSKRETLDMVSLAGAVLSAIGIAMFAGILPVEGTVNNGRLMFTFQYANTAGAFFAVCSLLLLSSPSPKKKISALLPIIALALTQSVGAIIVFLIAVLALGIKGTFEGEIPKKAFIFATAGVIVAGGAAIALMWHRVAQASQTFIERFIQILDAGGVIASSPLTGIGPDQWQFFYPNFQSAQYQAAQVHSSYMQLGVDAGALGLLLLVAFVVLGVWGSARRHEGVFLVCSAMMGVHALVDFDFQFCAMILLFCALTGEMGEEGLIKIPAGKASRTAGFLLCGLALVGSAVGVYLDTVSLDLERAANEGDVQKADEIIASSDVFSNDRKMIAAAMDAHIAAKELDYAVDAAQKLDMPDHDTSYRLLVSLAGLGDDGKLATGLSSALSAFPYDVDFYDAVKQLVEENGAGDEVVEAYNEAAERAGDLTIEGHASWLENQKKPDLVEIGEG